MPDSEPASGARIREIRGRPRRQAAAGEADRDQAQPDPQQQRREKGGVIDRSPGDALGRQDDLIAGSGRMPEYRRGEGEEDEVEIGARPERAP